EEEERRRALHQDVVRAVVHETVSHGVVPPRLDRDLELGADAVGARDEERGLRALGDAEHAAESAELPPRAGGDRALLRGLDAMLRGVRGVDVHARRAIVEALAHAPRPRSNATRSWNASTRSLMSSASISRMRAIENFSTANEPIAEPQTTARFMLA